MALHDCSSNVSSKRATAVPDEPRSARIPSGREVLVRALPKHLPQLRASARRLTRDESDAHDLVQDTCVRALAELGRRQGCPANVGAWLHVILRNVWFNVLRARRTRKARRGALRGEPDDRTLLRAEISGAQLVRLWESVPRRAGGVVVDCLLDGEARDVVAARRGITVGAIDASIYRVRRVFRAAGLGG